MAGGLAGWGGQAFLLSFFSYIDLLGITDVQLWLTGIAYVDMLTGLYSYAYFL